MYKTIVKRAETSVSHYFILVVAFFNTTKLHCLYYSKTSLSSVATNQIV